MKVLIAHAEGEPEQAEKLAQPIAEAGYEPVHYGTILVGESLTEEAGKVLNSNGPVVLCGTIKAAGTRFARRLVNAARSGGGAVRVFPVRMDREADLEALTWDSKIAEYWQNPIQAAQELIKSLNEHYPVKREDIQTRYTTDDDPVSDEDNSNILQEEDIVRLLDIWNGNFEDDLKIDSVRSVLNGAWRSIAYMPMMADKLFKKLQDYSVEIKDILLPICLVGCGKEIPDEYLCNFFISVKQLMSKSGTGNCLELLVFSSRMLRYIFYHHNKSLSIEAESSVIDYINNHHSELFAADLYLRSTYRCLNISSISKEAESCLEKIFNRYINENSSSVVAKLHLMLNNPVDYIEKSIPLRQVVDYLCSIAKQSSNSIEYRWVTTAATKILSIYSKNGEDDNNDNLLIKILDSINRDFIDSSPFFQHLYLKKILNIFVSKKDINILIEYEKFFIAKKKILFPVQIAQLQLEYASCLYILFSFFGMNEESENTRFSRKIKENQPVINDILFENHLLIEKYPLEKNPIAWNVHSILQWISSYTNKLYKYVIFRLINNNHLFSKYFIASRQIPPLHEKFCLSIYQSIEYYSNYDSTLNEEFFCRSMPMIMSIKPHNHMDIVIKYIEKSISSKQIDIFENRFFIASTLYKCYFYGDCAHRPKLIEYVEHFKKKIDTVKTEICWLLVTCITDTSITNENNFLDKMFCLLEKHNRKGKIYQLSLKRNETFEMIFPSELNILLKLHQKNTVAGVAKNELDNHELWNTLATTVFNKSNNKDARLLKTASLFYSFAKYFAREKKRFDQKFSYNFIRSESLYYKTTNSKLDSLFFQDTVFYLQRPQSKIFHYKEECLSVFFELAVKHWHILPEYPKNILLTDIVPKDKIIKNFYLLS